MLPSGRYWAVRAQLPPPSCRFKAYDGPRGKNDSKSMNSRWQSMQKKGSSVSAADAGVTK